VLAPALLSISPYRQVLLTAPNAKLMMAIKVVVQLICLILTFSPTQEGVRMIHDADDDLAGSVRTIRIEKAQIILKDNNYVEEPRILSEKITYNSKGRRLDVFLYNRDGVFTAKSVYSYDAEGELTEITEYNMDGSLLNKKVYTRSSDRRSIEEVTYNDGESTSSNKTIHTLNDADKQTSLTTFDANGVPSIKVIISYNGKGKIREVVMCSSVKNGMIVPGSGGRSVVLSDDVKDKMKGVSPCSDSLFISKTIFTHDDDGHLIETATYTHDNFLVSKEIYTYEFDSHGNWIKQTKSKWNIENGKYKPVETTYREIRYY